MYLKKIVVLGICLIGAKAIAYAQWNQLPAQLRTMHAEKQAINKTYGNIIMSRNPNVNEDIGRALWTISLPQVGGKEYAREVLKMKKATRRSRGKFYDLINKRVVLSSTAVFPCYVADFRSAYKDGGFSEPGELWANIREALTSFGENAQFAGTFVSTFEEAVTFRVNPLNWFSVDRVDFAIRSAWMEGLTKKSGFFVIAVKEDINSPRHYDILLLDLDKREFVSLQQSKYTELEHMVGLNP